MIPASFEYVRAESVDHAVSLLQEHGEEAKLLAGGHSLLPLMKLRLAQPGVLIDIGRLGDLANIRDDGDMVSIGALTHHAQIEHSPLLRQECPVVSYTAGQVGDLQVRHRGTIGGSVAHGDSASDLPTVLLAVDAVMVAHGPEGTREIPASDFFTGFWETALTDVELLTTIKVPKLPNAGWSYQKFNRRAQDWAIVGAVAVKNGTTRVGLTNMGSIPLRATAVEAALQAGASLSDAAAVAAEGTNAPADVNGSAAYREHLARVLVRRALEEAGS